MIQIQLSKSEQIHIAKILLIFTTGERFPRARLQPPRRRSLLQGLQTRAIPAGVVAFRSNQKNRFLYCRIIDGYNKVYVRIV